MKLFRKTWGCAVATNDSNVKEIMKKFADMYGVEGDETFILDQDGLYVISFLTNEKRKRIRKEIKILFGRKYDMKFGGNTIGIIKKIEAK